MMRFKVLVALATEKPLTRNQSGRGMRTG